MSNEIYSYGCPFVDGNDDDVLGVRWMHKISQNTDCIWNLMVRWREKIEEKKQRQMNKRNLSERRVWELNSNMVFGAFDFFVLLLPFFGSPKSERKLHNNIDQLTRLQYFIYYHFCEIGYVVYEQRISLIQFYCRPLLHMSKKAETVYFQCIFFFVVEKEPKIKQKKTKHDFTE